MDRSPGHDRGTSIFDPDRSASQLTRKTARFRQAKQIPGGRRRASARVALAAAVIGTAAVAGGYLAVRAATDEYQGPGQYAGQEIKNERDSGVLLAIDPLPDDPEVLVRSKPVRGDDSLVGYAKKGDLVQARAYYGVKYESGSNIGEIEGPDQKIYGTWYKIQAMSVYDNKGDESSKKLVHDVFIAGNFLRAATKQERTDFFESSE